MSMTEAGTQPRLHHEVRRFDQTRDLPIGLDAGDRSRIASGLNVFLADRRILVAAGGRTASAWRPLRNRRPPRSRPPPSPTHRLPRSTGCRWGPRRGGSPRSFWRPVGSPCPPPIWGGRAAAAGPRPGGPGDPREAATCTRTRTPWGRFVRVIELITRGGGVALAALHPTTSEPRASSRSRCWSTSTRPGSPAGSRTIDGCCVRGREEKKSTRRRRFRYG